MRSYIEDHYRYLTMPTRYGGIDLLRCVAVTSVVLYHFQIFPIGWIGVDIFFVLSGFLIGGMILSALERDRFSFRVFYWHRALRILPTYYATILGLAMLNGVQFKGLVPVLGMFQTTANYFWGVEYNPLTPDGSWSLVIEEHFYIIAPLAMFLAYKGLGKRGVFYLCVTAVLIGPLVRWGMTASFPPDNGDLFFMSFIQFHSRFDELAIGIALAAAPPIPKSLGLTMATAIVSILGMAWFIWVQVENGHLHTPWLMTRETIWMPTFFAIIFGSWVVALKDIRAKFKPVQILARLSYPLYLFHFFVLISGTLQPEMRDFLYLKMGTSAAITIYLSACLFLAYLVSLLVEFPFLCMYKPELRRTVGPGAGGLPISRPAR